MVAIITQQSSNPVRSIYIPEATLKAIKGVGIYTYQPGQQVPEEVLTYPLGEGAFQYYEVSQISGKGSWWRPTAAVNLAPFSWNNSRWGGLGNLEEKGKGVWTKEGENRVVFPGTLFWWIPQDVLVLPTFPLVPSQNESSIIGVFPKVPPGGVPPKPTVKETDDGVLITVPPSNSATTVNVEQVSN